MVNKDMTELSVSELSVAELLEMVGKEAVRIIDEESPAGQPLSMDAAFDQAVTRVFRTLSENKVKKYQRLLRIEKLKYFEREVLDTIKELQVAARGRPVTNGQVKLKVQNQGAKAQRHTVLNAFYRLEEFELLERSGGKAWSLPADWLAELLNDEIAQRRAAKGAA